MLLLVNFILIIILSQMSIIIIYLELGLIDQNYSTSGYRLIIHSIHLFYIIWSRTWTFKLFRTNLHAMPMLLNMSISQTEESVICSEKLLKYAAQYRYECIVWTARPREVAVQESTACGARSGRRGQLAVAGQFARQLDFGRVRASIECQRNLQIKLVRQNKG